MKDPQEEAASRVGGLLSGSFYDYPHIPPELRLSAYQLRGYNPNRIEGMLNKSIAQAGNILSGQRNLALTQAGNQGLAQARALNLQNPYAFQRVAQNDVYGRYANAFGNLALERGKTPLQAIQTQLGINQANLSPFLSMLQLMQGNVGQRATSVGPALAGGLISAGGQAAAGKV